MSGKTVETRAEIVRLGFANLEALSHLVTALQVAVQATIDDPEREDMRVIREHLEKAISGLTAEPEVSKTP